MLKRIYFSPHIYSPTGRDNYYNRLTWLTSTKIGTVETVEPAGNRLHPTANKINRRFKRAQRHTVDDIKQDDRM